MIKLLKGIWRGFMFFLSDEANPNPAYPVGTEQPKKCRKCGTIQN